MEKYDFDEIIPRKNTNSLKWAPAKRLSPDLPEDYIPLWIADMDFACPQNVLDAMKAKLDDRILGYSVIYDPTYFDAVKSWMYRRHHLTLEDDQIVFSSGVVTAIEAAIANLTRPGDGVLVLTPCYGMFQKAVLKQGRTLVRSSLVRRGDLFEVDLTDFEKKIVQDHVTLYILCNPHNPTGRAWSERELREMVDICTRHGVFVISDEIHGDLTRRGAAYTSVLSLYPGSKNVVACTAPSKTFNLPGNHLSNILFNDRDMARKWNQERICGMPNPLSIEACRAAYNECEDYVDALQAYLDENFRFFCDLAAKKLPKARVYVPEATYLAWVDLSGYGLTDKELSRRIAKGGVMLSYHGEFVADDEGYARINIACPRALLTEAVERISRALETVSR